MSAPLSSLKILDFSTLLPGPFASKTLADLGAEVLRVETSSRPDITRSLPANVRGGLNAHAFLNRSKHSIGLNLKSVQPGASRPVFSLQAFVKITQHVYVDR